MLTVHHLQKSQSERIVWLCEELAIPYALKVYPRAGGMAPPEYKALHTIGRAPIITDGDLSLPESGAIIEYIVGRHGGGRLGVGADAPNFADYLFWLHFANASLMPSLIADRDARAAGGEDSPRKAYARERANEAWTLIEQRLGEAPFFAGEELTAADIMMVFNLTTMRLYVPNDLADKPNVRAYLQRIGARPAYRRAMEKGDPGMAPNLT